jgi:hypothetical protein
MQPKAGFNTVKQHADRAGIGMPEVGYRFAADECLPRGPRCNNAPSR